MRVYAGQSLRLIVAEGIGVREDRTIPGRFHNLRSAYRAYEGNGPRNVSHLKASCILELIKVKSKLIAFRSRHVSIDILRLHTYV